MEMHQLRYFLAICETLNFTRAAEKCNISQPALTKGIQRLEKDLGGVLFDRSRNIVALTNFGMTMKPSLQNLYDMACRTRSQAQSLSSEKSNRLRVGVMCTINFRRLADFLAAFEHRHSDIRLSYEDGTLMDLHDRLDKGEIDIAIGSTPYELPKRFSATPLFKESFCIAFPANHRFASLRRIPMKEMHNEIYVSRFNCEYSDLLTDMMTEQGVAVVVRHETAREDWIQEMVMAGMGVAYIPESTPLHAELQRRPVCDPEVTRTVSLLNVVERATTNEMQIFLTAAKEHCWNEISILRID